MPTVGVEPSIRRFAGSRRVDAPNPTQISPAPPARKDVGTVPETCWRGEVSALRRAERLEMNSHLHFGVREFGNTGLDMAQHGHTPKQRKAIKAQSKDARRVMKNVKSPKKAKKK